MLSDYRRFFCFAAMLVLLLDQQIVSAATRDVVAKHNDGVNALKAKNFQLAIETLTAVLKADPTYQLARENLAIAYNNLGVHESSQPKVALVAFEHSLYFAPGMPGVLLNLNHSIHSLGLNPDSYDDHNKLGNEALARKDSIGAIIEFREALRIKNDVALARKLALVPKPIDVPLFDAKPLPPHNALNPAGLPFSSGTAVTISNAGGINYSDYMQNMQMLIKSNWSAPRPTTPIAKKVLVNFRVNRDGSCSNIIVTNPSDSTKVLDESCIQAISQTKLNPLPAGSPEYVNVNFNFDYNKSLGYFPSASQHRSSWSISPPGEPKQHADGGKIVSVLPSTTGGGFAVVSQISSHADGSNPSEVTPPLVVRNSDVHFVEKPVDSTKSTDIPKVVEISKAIESPKLADSSTKTSEAPSNNNSIEIDGTVTNVCNAKSTGVTMYLIELGSGRFIASGRYDSKNLYGHFFNVPGRVLTSGKDFSSIQFTGSIEFGNDGSGLPEGSKADYVMTISFTPTSVEGVYRIADFRGIGFDQYGTMKLNAKGKIPGATAP